MTWKEFKAFVDAQLREQGISEDAPIWYIDISHPDNSRPSSEVTVALDEVTGLTIS